MKKTISLLMIILLLTFLLGGCLGSSSSETKNVEVKNVKAISETKLSVQVRGFEGTIENTGNVAIDNCKIEFYVYKTAAKEEYRSDFDGFVVEVGSLAEGATYDFHKVNDSFNSDIEYYDYKVIY